jgi:hypothetical protein
MCTDEPAEIEKKLPCSKNDKLLIYSTDGMLFKPERKPLNLYEELKIAVTKYDDIFKELSSKASFWVTNGEVSENRTGQICRFYCQNDILGEQISENLLNQLLKCNTNAKFSNEIEKYSTLDKKQIVLDLRPTIISLEFFSRVVTCINMSLTKKNYFLTFDFTANLSKFGEKMEKNCGERRVVHEGFVVSTPNFKKGLKEEKFEEFLNQLLTYSYSTEKCRKVKKETKFKVQ